LLLVSDPLRRASGTLKPSDDGRFGARARARAEGGEVLAANNMRGAAAAVGAFYSKATVRASIRQALQPVINADNEERFLSAAVQAIRDIRQLDDFGSAIATRLIALTRPDRAISVNAGSAPLLSRLTGLPKTASILASEQNYPRLLQWIFQQPWYNVSEPQAGFEQTIWSMRAALIDSFVSWS